jgi:hypothetical protein
MAQDQGKSSETAWLKEIWGSLKDGSMNFNPEKNSSLNAGVLLRCCIKFVKYYTLNLYHLSCFAKGLAQT